MASPFSVKVERNVPVPMRDGTILYADVYRPDAPGQFPALLQRTCYSKDLPLPTVVLVFPITAASRGYAVVVQDVRGRYASQGEFYPFRHEIEDGYDSVEWAAAQPWCDGNVGMYGGSYLGATQWLAAIARPPHLKAIFPSLTASDFYRGWAYQGGAFQLAFNEIWALLGLALLDGVSRLGLSDEELAGEQGKLAQAIDNFDETARFLPLKDFPHLQQPGLAPYFYDWLAHPAHDDYWRRWSIETQHDQVSVPAFNLGAWYDIFLGGTLSNFVGMRKNGGSEQARRGQKLLVGPWYHNIPLDARVGDVSLPLRALLDLDGLHLRWFDYWLKGIDNGIGDEPPVEIFVMGENVWRS
ncbi:MAG: CocE/NonD family hydrolase, partial [Chloroflexota bacterium]|nr:CocE/NonD family hydrolase [Chloroflexota bacterium]